MYNNNNMQLIRIKREINYRPIALIALIIVSINVSVFYAAVRVNKNREVIIEKYISLKNEEEYCNNLKMVFTLNNCIKTKLEEFVVYRTIIFNETTQDKLNNTMKKRNDKKVVYLTFDDGPSKTVTPQILDTLKENNINASFFVLGTFVEYYPDVVKRCYSEGNYIGNHGYSHIYSKIYESKEAFFEEIDKTEKIIGKAIDDEQYNSHLLRMPGGSNGGKYSKIKNEIKIEANNKAYGYIDWNALTNDSTGNFTKEELIENLKNTCAGKESVVVLMHDAGNKQTTAEALTDVIQYFKENGYEFRTFYDVMK